MKWSKDSGRELWCSEKSGGIERDWVGVPRRKISLNAETPDEMCVCARSTSIAAQDPYLREYEGCPSHQSFCKFTN